MRRSWQAPLALGFILALACLPSQAWPAQFTDKYDAEIQRAVKRWWADYPFWTAWKAQLYQESRLDPKAVSPVGARGLAQFMPGTWNDVARHLGFAGSPHEDMAIEAGAYYMAKMRYIWRRNRSSGARHPLAQASYNAGAGNIIKAQALCNNARYWPEISACLHLVTGERNAHETKTYVERIARWRKQMELQ